MRKENILMKEKKYYDLVSSFSELDLEDKKEEVLKHTLELLQLLYLKNKKLDKDADVLPVLNKYSDEDEYFNLLFSYIILCPVQQRSPSYLFLCLLSLRMPYLSLRRLFRQIRSCPKHLRKQRRPMQP